MVDPGLPDPKTISPKLMEYAPCCGHIWGGHHWDTNQCVNCPKGSLACPRNPASPIGTPISAFYPSSEVPKLPHGFADEIGEAGMK